MNHTNIYKVDVRVYWDVYDRDYPQLYQTLKFDKFPAVEFQDKKWLFLDIQKREKQEDAIPERIVFHNDWKFREIQHYEGYSRMFDFQLLAIVPLSVFYQEATLIRLKWGYEIIEYPEISLPFDFSFS